MVLRYIVSFVEDRTRAVKMLPLGLKCVSVGVRVSFLDGQDVANAQV